MYLGGNNHNQNLVCPPGGVFSQVVGRGSELNLSSRAALDVEKQGNHVQKIKICKISYLRTFGKSSGFEA